MNLRSSPRVFLFLLVCFFAFSSADLHAQAEPTASRRNSIDTYAAGSIGQTDYGKHGEGLLSGADFGTHFRLFEPALDLRYGFVSNGDLHEKTFLGGLRIGRPYGRFHPYLQGHIGYGVITFDNPSRKTDGTLYSFDNSKVYSFGGGLDYTLTHSFSVKLDGQYQFWNLGEGTSSIKFNPNAISIGVVYHVPYRILRPRSY